MDLNVSHRLLMDALFASPVELQELETGHGVLVTWHFSADVLKALRSTPGQTAAIIRQFFEPRAIALAQVFWTRNDGRGPKLSDDPLAPDSTLSGWCDVDGAVLFRTERGAWTACYRVVSRAHHEAFEAQFPTRKRPVTSVPEKT